jgi:hypothetical protein
MGERRPGDDRARRQHRGIDGKAKAVAVGDGGRDFSRAFSGVMAKMKDTNESLPRGSPAGLSAKAINYEK